MKLEGIIKQLANRINQPHVVKTYLEKVADTCYDKGDKDGKELEAQSNWIDVTDEEIEKAAFENLREQLPTAKDKALINLLARVQIDGAKWMRDKMIGKK